MGRAGPWHLAAYLLCSKSRGDLYFAAEGWDFEGPPPQGVYGTFPMHKMAVGHNLKLS